MNKISFFTPITYLDKPRTLAESFVEKVDSYFFLGGKKARILSLNANSNAKNAELIEQKSSLLATALKIASYLTIILPLILISLKAIIRSRFNVQIIKPCNDTTTPVPAPPRSTIILSPTQPTKPKPTPVIIPPSSTNLTILPQPSPSNPPILHVPSPVNETVDPLKQKIALSDQAKEKIGSLISKIIKCQDDPNIEWISKGKKKTTFVFKLKDEKDIIFKVGNPTRLTPKMGSPERMDGNDRIEERFKNIQAAEKICDKENLNLLIVPSAEKFEVNFNNKTFVVMAEKQVDIEHNESVQEKLFYDNANKMEETVRQLAKFIIKSGFTDVTWRNIPIINNSLQEKDLKIGLIDLEEFSLPDIGILGVNCQRRGLINCLFSEKLIEIALEEARKNGITDDQIKQSRMAEINEHVELHKVYDKKGIHQNPQQPIQVPDLKSLGLNLDETTEIEIQEEVNTNDQTELVNRRVIKKMSEAIEVVINEINLLLKNSLPEDSTKAKRNIILDIGGSSLSPYSQAYSESDKSSCWLKRIVEALVAKEHIFKLLKADNLEIILQA